MYVLIKNHSAEGIVVVNISKTKAQCIECMESEIENKITKIKNTENFDVTKEEISDTKFILTVTQNITYPGWIYNSVLNVQNTITYEILEPESINLSNIPPVSKPPVSKPHVSKPHVSKPHVSKPHVSKPSKTHEFHVKSYDPKPYIIDIELRKALEKRRIYLGDI